MKKTIRLSQTGLKNLIKESVKRVLRETIIGGDIFGTSLKPAPERLPKGWEKFEREDDDPIYRDGDGFEYVKDEYGNLKPMQTDETRLRSIVRESIKNFLKETKLGAPDPEPKWGWEVNGKSAYLITDNGKGKMVAVLDNLRFVGNSIIGVNRETGEDETLYLVSLFGRQVDGSTLPSATTNAEGELLVNHLKWDGEESYCQLLIDDYLMTPESAADWDYAHRTPDDPSVL